MPIGVELNILEILKVSTYYDLNHLTHFLTGLINRRYCFQLYLISSNKKQQMLSRTFCESHMTGKNNFNLVIISVKKKQN
jgi:hypothetical protein